VAAAEKALADLRNRAADAEKVGGAERSLERSKYGVEEANFRVTDAERALAELRADPSSSAIAIRRAEIDLAEAKLSVSDAVQSVTDAERRLNAERNVAPTADEIAEAERNLERAKYAVTDALDAQTRATEEQSSAQQNLNEITYGATVGSVIYESALKALEDAKADQADASDALADAMRRERDAMYELVEAQNALLAVQGKTKAGVVARVQGALGVSVGAGGSIVENIGTVSGNTTGGGAAGGGTVVNLNVQAGMFTSPVEVGNEIIDALRAWERSNGSISLAL
jgi:chromosome segregation ATPase